MSVELEQNNQKQEPQRDPQREELKFCKNCRYARYYSSSSLAEDYKCVSPKNLLDEVSLVTGEPYHKYARASEARLDVYGFSSSETGVAKSCGKSGNWFAHKSSVLVGNMSEEQLDLALKQVKKDASSLGKRKDILDLL